MKHKIIIADDSLTIQKVIKITLAKENFELIECLEDHKLHELCKEVKPTLVLLDFNLSESKTGYDLCQEIKNSDVAKIVMLYGTFDTVDENLLDHCGANGHIVKPFEGGKFVNLCRQLIEDACSSDEDIIQPQLEVAIPDPIEETEIDLDDQWVMNQPEVTSHEEDKTGEHDMSHFLEPEVEENQLQIDASDWGVDIPGVIDSARESTVELPPIIDEAADELNFDEAELDEESSLPKDIELEYPNVAEIRSSVEAEPAPAPTAKLTPLHELQTNESPLEIDLDDTLGTKTDDEVRALEEQIANETEEDLWAVDDEEEVADAEKVESEEKPAVAIQEAAAVESSPAPSISKEEILAALELQIEEIVNSRVEAIIEKIAWDVIPDLAENLISKELKSLAQSIDD